MGDELNRTAKRFSNAIKRLDDLAGGLEQVHSWRQNHEKKHQEERT